ncbi:hypothetical protein AX774_g5171 [Zancudomyces culisetae]|uniref:Uncharacterized protein n=1 Tax=Zancudomyces culisetae TaxID=1213189 RepID=A0A1R1PKA8_ZANCU|nr:hypothetical protein AX774_g5171 [Zancudomyces culisetae]|eukprot:OMH81369.1 hypothetical protein AX774_g5171 [Zancudomyces culisetae]
MSTRKKNENVDGSLSKLMQLYYADHSPTTYKSPTKLFRERSQERLLNGKMRPNIQRKDSASVLNNCVDPIMWDVLRSIDMHELSTKRKQKTKMQGLSERSSQSTTHNKGVYIDTSRLTKANSFIEKDIATNECRTSDKNVSDEETTPSTSRYNGSERSNSNASTVTYSKSLVDERSISEEAGSPEHTSVESDYQDIGEDVITPVTQENDTLASAKTAYEPTNTEYDYSLLWDTTLHDVEMQEKVQAEEQTHSLLFVFKDDNDQLDIPQNENSADNTIENTKNSADGRDDDEGSETSEFINMEPIPDLSRKFSQGYVLPSSDLLNPELLRTKVYSKSVFEIDPAQGFYQVDQSAVSAIELMSKKNAEIESHVVNSMFNELRQSKYIEKNDNAEKGLISILKKQERLTESPIMKNSPISKNGSFTKFRTKLTSIKRKLLRGQNLIDVEETKPKGKFKARFLGIFKRRGL